MKINKLTKTIATFIICAVLPVSSAGAAAQAEPVKIDAEHFPDDTFRAGIAGYDTDKDGCLSEQEISMITSLNYDGGDNGAWKEAASFKGIEYLTALEIIDLSFNNVTELDLSANVKLKRLSLHNMPLQSINLKNNADLESFNGSGLELKSLDMTGCTNLKYFSLTDSAAAENIDFGNKPQLKRISCEGSGIKNLAADNMPELEKLNISGTKIAKLDVSKLSKLRILYCPKKTLKKLTLCNNKKLKVVLNVNDRLKINWKNMGKKAVIKASKKNILKIGSNGNITAAAAGKTKLACRKNSCMIKVQK